MRAALIATLILVGGCGHRYLALTVDRGCASEPIDDLAIVVMADGATSQTSHVAIDASTVWPLALSLELPPSVTGDATVTVTATKSGQLTSTATAKGSIGGSPAVVTLAWAGCGAMPDMQMARDSSTGNDLSTTSDMAVPPDASIAPCVLGVGKLGQCRLAN